MLSVVLVLKVDNSFAINVSIKISYVFFIIPKIWQKIIQSGVLKINAQDLQFGGLGIYAYAQYCEEISEQITWLINK